MSKRPTEADTFSVWGAPSKAVLQSLTPSQVKALKRYVRSVTDNCYRAAFDNGVSHAFLVVSETVAREWRNQQKRYRRAGRG